MADDNSSGALGAGFDPQGIGGPGAAAPANQLLINAQYVKDLSFENPRAPQSLVQPSEAPEVALDADVKGRSIAPDIYEVLLTISAEAKSKGETVFVVELTYGAVVTVRNTAPDLVPVLVLIETPRLLFPFARSIIADATRDGGFPPLLVNPIDFADLIRRQQLRAAQEGEAPATA